MRRQFLLLLTGALAVVLSNLRRFTLRRLSSRKVLVGACATLVAAGAALVPFALAAPTPTTTPSTDVTAALQTDDLPNAMEQARRAAREEAIAGVLTGKYTAVKNGASTVVDLGPDAGSASDRVGRGSGKNAKKGDGDGPRGESHRPRFVEIAREKTDQIFVVLVEFGDQQPSFPPDPAAQRTEGPLHNQIPQPDRSVDNSTVWRSDFSQPYFQDLYFGGGESLKNYMETQSSGRYSVNGTVTNWVKVNFTQRRYGTDLCGSNVCTTVYALVRDGAKAWVQDRLAAGTPMSSIKAQLAEFDKWDRYDQDQDGNFNEPDGFLDHFQIVHSGGDQADGDPIYASDAIWSHRSYSALAFGPSCTDPDPNTVCQTGTPVGGVINAQFQIVDDGTYTGFLIGDYTMQPENGGRSVFYHEYVHDLGLPDDYNLINGGDNNNEHWTLMAQSRLGAATDGGIGERGGDLGAWNKLQLGWLDHVTVNSNDQKVVNLGPQEFNTKDPQGLVVVLPDQHVTFDMGQPASGDKQFYSGHSDDSQVVMSRQVTVPAGGGTLTLKTRYDIEDDFDVARVVVDGTPVVGTVNGAPTQLPANQNGWTVGWEGSQGTYVDGSFPLPAGSHEVSIEYLTDAAVAGNDANLRDGVFIDSVALNGTELSEDGWTLDGFSLVGAQVVQDFEHFYIAGSRSYVSYDQYLKTGPYFFGYNPTFPDKVDHYAYQQGLLISYWNTLYPDNDTFEHPGFGRNLYIDAHPTPMPQASGPGGFWRARVQVYDAPFGDKKTDTVTLHVGGVPFTFGGLPGVSTFDDTQKYWFSELPNHGVKLPAVGVKIRVLNDSGGKTTVKVN
jgi:immune inhibitor A